MEDQQIAASDPCRIECVAVRITPYTDEAEPDHDQALTYRLETPIHLVDIHRSRQPSSDDVRVRTGTTLPWIVGFIAAEDHPEQAVLDVLTTGLQPKGVAIAVETWSRETYGTWFHTLVPSWLWRPVEHVKPPFPQMPGTRLLGIGYAYPSQKSHQWPNTRPGAGRYEVERGTYIQLSAGTGPPPPGVRTLRFSIDGAT